MDSKREGGVRPVTAGMRLSRDYAVWETSGCLHRREPFESLVVGLPLAGGPFDVGTSSSQTLPKPSCSQIVSLGVQVGSVYLRRLPLRYFFESCLQGQLRGQWLLSFHVDRMCPTLHRRPLFEQASVSVKDIGDLLKCFYLLWLNPFTRNGGVIGQSAVAMPVQMKFCPLLNVLSSLFSSLCPDTINSCVRSL